jgi:pyrophosphatase PpaX
VNESGTSPRYRVAIFDLDGTLADTLPLIYRAFNDALGPLYERELGETEIRGMFGPPDTYIFQAVAPEELAEEVIGRYMERYRRDHGELVNLFPGMADLLRDLATTETRLAVVTGKSRVTAIYTLEALGVLPHFEVIYAGDDVERQKPDPEALHAVFRDLGEEPGKDCVIVGDSRADVAAGKAAGLSTIAVLWGNPDHHELEDPKPDVVCESIDELRSALGLQPVAATASGAS